MGYSYASSEESNEAQTSTTGDRYLDVIVRTLLNFKIPNLEQDYSISDWVEMNKCAAELRTKEPLRINVFLVEEEGLYVAEKSEISLLVFDHSEECLLEEINEKIVLSGNEYAKADI